MSFILDALRKSEHERQRQTGPALAEVPVAAPKPRSNVWATGAIALLLVNLVVIGVLLIRKAAREPEAAVPAAMPAPAQAAPAATAPAPAQVTMTQTVPTGAAAAPPPMLQPARSSGAACRGLAQFARGRDVGRTADARPADGSGRCRRASWSACGHARTERPRVGRVRVAAGKCRGRRAAVRRSATGAHGVAVRWPEAADCRRGHRGGRRTGAQPRPARVLDQARRAHGVRQLAQVPRRRHAAGRSGRADRSRRTVRSSSSAAAGSCCRRTDRDRP